jgi:hypothetical protein
MFLEDEETSCQTADEIQKILDALTQHGLLLAILCEERAHVERSQTYDP